MRCGFCAREIPDEVAQQACGACPGGCRWIHCPFCGYRNPAPRGVLRRLLDQQGRKKD